MAVKLSADVVTPLRRVAQAAVDQVVAQGALGQVTILPSHAPFLTDLSPGLLELRAGPRADRFFVSGGFMEVERDRVVVLAETAEPAEEIDVARAKADLADAENKLKSLDMNTPEYHQEMGRAARARGRLAVAQVS